MIRKNKESYGYKKDGLQFFYQTMQFFLNGLMFLDIWLSILMLDDGPRFGVIALSLWFHGPPVAACYSWEGNPSSGGCGMRDLKKQWWSDMVVGLRPMIDLRVIRLRETENNE
ncbi:hypothetical protein Fot_26362 [Forsythia ovata]|uniref:Uncharacterized protein n=1 Tax=Forsythia ovata TaxID=205694 RepID=A0ABD1UBP0_9LAMI